MPFKEQLVILDGKKLCVKCTTSRNPNIWVLLASTRSMKKETR
jgi:hypothetical protein